MENLPRIERKGPSKSVPEIRILPRIKIPSKVAPELSIGSTAFSLPHSNSLGLKSKTALRSRSKSENIDKHSQANDRLIYDEYRHLELMNSCKLPNSKLPYWFLDNSEDQTNHELKTSPEFQPVFLCSTDIKNQEMWESSMKELLRLRTL